MPTGEQDSDSDQLADPRMTAVQRKRPFSGTYLARLRFGPYELIPAVNVHDNGDHAVPSSDICALPGGGTRTTQELAWLALKRGWPMEAPREHRKAPVWHLPSSWRIVETCAVMRRRRKNPARRLPPSALNALVEAKPGR